MPENRVMGRILRHNSDKGAGQGRNSLQQVLLGQLIENKSVVECRKKRRR